MNHLSSHELMMRINELQSKQRHHPTEMRARIISAMRRMHDERMEMERQRMASFDEPAGGKKPRSSKRAKRTTKKSCLRQHKRWVPACWSHRGYCRTKSNK